MKKLSLVLTLFLNTINIFGADQKETAAMILYNKCTTCDAFISAQTPGGFNRHWNRDHKDSPIIAPQQGFLPVTNACGCCNTTLSKASSDKRYFSRHVNNPNNSECHEYYAQCFMLQKASNTPPAKRGRPPKNKLVQEALPPVTNTLVQQTLAQAFQQKPHQPRAAAIPVPVSMGSNGFAILEEAQTRKRSAHEAAPADQQPYVYKRRRLTQENLATIKRINERVDATLRLMHQLPDLSDYDGMSTDDDE